MNAIWLHRSKLLRADLIKTAQDWQYGELT
jgi:hypothetical protein